MSVCVTCVAIQMQSRYVLTELPLFPILVAIRYVHLSNTLIVLKVGHQQMYDLERFYGTKVSFYKGTDSYKSYKLVQTSNFSVRLMP